jgi:hypothetical protein
VAVVDGEIILPRRSFTDVHELVYLFHSWQLILAQENIPAALRPLENIPSDLLPVMASALAAARAQLETAQAGTEISLRFAVTREFESLMRWGATTLADIEGTLGDEALDPNWQRALQLANDFVRAALEQLEAVALPD